MSESSYLQVADRLADGVPTGEVYVGVGPEQNFSYVAFRSFGRSRATYQPTYRTLLRARSPSGRFGSFLDSPYSYGRTSVV